MDRKQVIDKITSSLISRAGNGNGLILRGPNGQEIAWCAGANYDRDNPEAAHDQIAQLVDHLLQEHERRVVDELRKDARDLTKRSAALRQQADSLDEQVVELEKAADLLSTRWE